MTFLELLRRLEDGLGNRHLPLNPAPTGIKDILSGNALHHELVRDTIRAIYRGNRCQRLSDAVTTEATFQALAPVRTAALASETADIELYRFLDDLSVAIHAGFDNRIEHKTATAVTAASVILLEPFRRARRIKSWA
jgi:hypothetical protein